MLDGALRAGGAIFLFQDSRPVSSADLCDGFGSLANEVNENTCRSHLIGRGLCLALVIAQDDTASPWQSWQPAEHSGAEFHLQV